MMRWYRSLIPGRMPLPLAAFVALIGVSTVLLWIATNIGSGIVIRLQAGDSIRFAQVRQGADSTEAHRFTIEKLGIDLNLDDGRFASDPPDGGLDADAPEADAPDGALDADARDGALDVDVPVCGAGLDAPGGALVGYEITFTEPGQYIISDCAHPRGHGSAKFVVTDDTDGGVRRIVTGAFIVEDGRFVLRTSETEAQFGQPPGSQIVSRTAADQIIFLALLGGSVLAVPVIAFVKRRRWWVWGIFGIVGGVLGVGQPFLTSVTVAGAVLLAERPRPPSAEPEAGRAAEDEDVGPPEDLPEGPPTQDQRTLPPATAEHPRPPRSRRRPRY